MLRFVYHQPIFVLIIYCVILLIIWAILNSKFAKIKTLTNIFMLIGSILIIAYSTLYKRTAGHLDIELRPFYTFVLAQQHPEYYRTFFMNALLFVPLGLSMPYIFSKKPHKRNVFFTIVFSAVLSVGIEFLQYYYHLGRCETDDIIANTLGAAVGTLSYLLYIRILKNREESLMNSKISDNQKLLLQLCAKSLFNKDVTVSDEFDIKKLVEESKRQTVFPTIYNLIKDKCDADYGKVFLKIISKNIRVECAHNEVYGILSDNNIPCVILKGVASASYYKEPMLRMMGDIDVLVAPNDIVKADKLLKSIGFVTTDDTEGDDMHIGYKREDGISCELHRRIGWAPNNSAGVMVNKYLSAIFENSVEYKTSNCSCIVPCEFHHGLILLLHTATHLTHEGIGLRHLCDWAVFVNGFSNDEFVNLFEKPLKEMGLWRFAQLLTLCCVKHLGCGEMGWAGQTDDNLIDSIVLDILNGGNFGTKDADRYNQIKYISDRKEGTTAKKNIITQLCCSINEKTKKEFSFTNKHKFLLPMGWIFTVCKYLYLVIMGKRKLDNASTIFGAKQRKEIYEEFDLFKS